MVDKRELHLIHDWEVQAIYTPEADLAISSDRVDLRHVFKGIRDFEEEIADLDAQAIGRRRAEVL